jgi:hypothetical protein
MAGDTQIDFDDAVGRLQAWFHQRVAVALILPPSTDYRMALTGILNRALEPTDGHDSLTREQVVRERLDAEGTESDLAEFEQSFDPATADPVFYFSVGSEEPGERCYFTLSKATFTAAWARLDEAPLPMLIVESRGGAVLIVTLVSGIEPDTSWQ